MNSIDQKHLFEIKIFCINWASLLFTVLFTGKSVSIRAMQLITCDCHAHLVSKAGSVISSKSPSRAFSWSGIYYTEP